MNFFQDNQFFFLFFFLQSCKSNGCHFYHMSELIEQDNTYVNSFTVGVTIFGLKSNKKLTHNRLTVDNILNDVQDCMYLGQ